MKKAQATEVTITEAMRLSSFSRQTIYNLVRRKKITARKLGWQHFIDRRSLAEYCAKRGRPALA